MNAVVPGGSACLPLSVGALTRFLFLQFRSQRVAEIGHFHDRADFQNALLPRRIGAALRPFDRILEGVHVPNPKTGNQLTGVREWPTHHVPACAGEFYTCTLCAGMKTLSCKHHAGLD